MSETVELRLYSPLQIDIKIGRASCRERVWLMV